MGQQQWEYCQLILWESKQHKARFGGESGFSYGCELRYHSTSGDIVERRLAELDRVIPTNPFRRAMALLGVAGWELVSVQHGTTAGTLYNGRILWDNVVAYFKRPVVPGRAIDEPELGALEG
jgi:hypothetical protein